MKEEKKYNRKSCRNMGIRILEGKDRVKVYNLV